MNIIEYDTITDKNRSLSFKIKIINKIFYVYFSVFGSLGAEKLSPNDKCQRDAPVYALKKFKNFFEDFLKSSSRNVILVLKHLNNTHIK